MASDYQIDLLKMFCRKRFTERLHKIRSSVENVYLQLAKLDAFRSVTVSD